MSQVNDPKNRPNVTFHRGIEHAAGADHVEQWSNDEFPHRSDFANPDGSKLPRRDFLKLTGGTIALGALMSGCRFLPQRKLVPAVVKPEYTIPGKPLYYASSCALGGYGVGLLIKTHEGRPIKIDGHPEHPAMLGACDPKTQAELFNLYDPDRLRSVRFRSDVSFWGDFVAKSIEQISVGEGAGAVILTRTVGSPTLRAQIQNFLSRYPQARWVQYEPINRDNARQGAVQAFGRPVETIYDFSQADVIATLDCDLFEHPQAKVRYTNDVMMGRSEPESGLMNRLYAAESVPTTFGVISDHRMPVKASHISAFAQAIAAAIGVSGFSQSNLPAGISQEFFQSLVRDLQSAGSRAVVVPGEHQPPEVHAIAHAINQHLGNSGGVIQYLEPAISAPTSQTADLRSLVTLMNEGRVRYLLSIDSNPVFEAPADVDFAAALNRVQFTASMCSHLDETARACDWRLPISHFLEAWGDTVAYDGTVSIAQPMLQPLYDSKSAIEALDLLSGGARTGEQILMAHYAGVESGQTQSGEQASPSSDDQFARPSNEFWRHALANGVVPGTIMSPAEVSIIPGLPLSIARGNGGTGMDLVFLPDPCIHDGRFANNAWMQELPKPIVKLTWDNALLMSKATAEKLGVSGGTKYLGFIDGEGNARMVEIAHQGRTLKVPIFVHLGIADDTVVLYLGGGRRHGGQYAVAGDQVKGGGFDAYSIRTSESPWIVQNVEVTSTSGGYPLANTQFHDLLEVTPIDSGRHIIQNVSLMGLVNGDEHSEGSGHGHGHGEREPMSMYGDPWDHQAEDNYQWAMTIDLNLCVGCNACVTACQAENNIATVGKREVQRGRSLHWMRIDRYYKGTDGQIDEKNPPTFLQPVTCMHCEKAPCEPVCPVAATVHSHDGLNQMVYNRCVGTRYCSNNCPYKVRRFNFLNYGNHHDVPVKKMLWNPDVTVRGRGVMEKCTYCVQRISAARIEAKKEQREIRDGEVKTACQVACPARAIEFGDMRVESNRVAQKRNAKRSYALLEDLNTRPRTTYLKRVLNIDEEVHS